MRRRDFVRVAGAAIAAGTLPTCSPDGEGRGGDAADRRADPGDADSARLAGWCWVHGDRDHDAGEWRRRFARLRSGGVTGVLVGGGDAARVAAAAHAEGLSFHRWFWTCNRNADAWARDRHPEWFTVSRELRSSLEHPPYVDYYRWVCPTRGPVRAYLRGLVDGIAAQDHVDGVHLDYVRHADVILPRGLWAKYDLVQDREQPEFDFCYCDVCRETFAAEDGRDPLAIPDPAADEAWRRFRWDSVTGLVHELASAVAAHGKPLSAAVFPTPAIARRLVRQDWDAWPLDLVFPMLYHAFYEEGIEWIGAGVREGVAALGGTPLVAGLYLPDLDPESLAAAVAEARTGGVAGVSVFQMEALTDGHLAALREGLG